MVAYEASIELENTSMRVSEREYDQWDEAHDLL